jgi:hypothetical protein
MWSAMEGGPDVPLWSAFSSPVTTFRRRKVRFAPLPTIVYFQLGSSLSAVGQAHDVSLTQAQ